MQATIELNARPILSDAHILIVEDDVFIGMELEAVLSNAGTQVVSSCSSVASALKAIAEDAPAAAILDIHLGAETAAPIARDLAQRGVPFVFYTGQMGTDSVLNEWPHRMVLQKPAPARKIIEAVTALIGHRKEPTADAVCF